MTLKTCDVMKTCAVILCAGQSRRMKSKLSKVLHSVGNFPLVAHVEAALIPLGVDLLFVINPELAEAPFFKERMCAIQERPWGTADALKAALKRIPRSVKRLLVVCGDTPLLKTDILSVLLSDTCDLSFLTFDLREVSPHHETLTYGRVLKGIEGTPYAICEFKDATKEEHHISHANAGVYCFDLAKVDSFLEKVDSVNAQGEYYLTDSVSFFYKKGFSISSHEVPYEYVMGVNSREDLADVEALFQKRYRHHMMSSGVTLIDSKTTFFSFDTQIGQDTIIEPFVYFGPGVKVDSNVHVRSFSYIEHTHLKSHCEVGPFVRLRSGCVLHEHVEIGNFVEAKETIFEQGVKAKHLSYLGNAHIGQKCNIGAGAIVCNYDGLKKYTTTLGDRSFIGSNTTLIAPLSIGSDCFVAAGSTITHSIPNQSLAIARPLLTIKEGWTLKHFKKKKGKPQDS